MLDRQPLSFLRISVLLFAVYDAGTHALSRFIKIFNVRTPDTDSRPTGRLHSSVCAMCLLWQSVMVFEVLIQFVGDAYDCAFAGILRQEKCGAEHLPVCI